MLVKNVLFERRKQFMIDSFKNINLAWIKKIGVTGYTWLLVYRRAFGYEEGMHVGPGWQIIGF